MLQRCRYVQLILYQNPRGVPLWFIEKPGTQPLIGVSRPSNFSFNISHCKISEAYNGIALLSTFISHSHFHTTFILTHVINTSLTNYFDLEAAILDYQIHARAYFKFTSKMFRQPYLNLTHCLNSGTMWSKTHDHELDYHIWCVHIACLSHTRPQTGTKCTIALWLS